jgi:hypothetical protein
LQKWQAGWSSLFKALDLISDDGLSRVIDIRDQGLTLLEVINRKLSHYPFHVGKMIDLLS